MNALQQLIQDWIDAEPERSERMLARRAGFKSASTVHAIMDRDDPRGLPRESTLKKLAHGLGQPFGVVQRAAAEAAGFRVEQLDSESPETQAWMALLADLPDDKRAELWDIGRMYLRRVKDLS